MKIAQSVNRLGTEAVYDIFGFQNDSISFDLDFDTKNYGQLNVRGLNLKDNTIVELNSL